MFIPQQVTCHCGKTFTQRRYGQKYCDPGCRSKRKNPAWNRAGSVAARRRRRARRAATWDGVTDAEILERDRWMCGICRKRIGKKFRYPHPRSASVDHLLPLSLGGDDTALNKRAAHLGCNVTRGNGRHGEQMPLPFGVDGGGLLSPRPPRPTLCRTCGWPLAGGKCGLHSLVRFRACDHCERLFVARRADQRMCRDAACKRDRLVSRMGGKVRSEEQEREARERKRQRDRERMQRLRATPEGHERIAAIKGRHAVKRLEQRPRYTDDEFDAVLRRLGKQYRENRGRFWRAPAAPVQGAQGRGSPALR